MKYKVICKVQDEFNLKMSFEIETKGKNRKVLRAAIKKELINFLKENDNCCGKVTNIEILDIIKTEHIRPKQVFQAENEYENFITKILKQQ
jgi:hypothetical protein